MSLSVAGEQPYSYSLICDRCGTESIAASNEVNAIASAYRGGWCSPLKGGHDVCPACMQRYLDDSISSAVEDLMREKEGMSDALLDPMKLKMDLDAAVRTLPNDPDRIAEMFERLGIRGDTFMTSCPAALYLRGRLLPSWPTCAVGVNTERIYVVARQDNRLSACSAQRRSRVVSAFVERFDNRGYPKLIGRS